MASLCNSEIPNESYHVGTYLNQIIALPTLSSLYIALYIALSRFSVLISTGQTVLCECPSGFLTKSVKLSVVFNTIYADEVNF